MKTHDSKRSADRDRCVASIECLEGRTHLSHSHPPTAALTSGSLTTAGRYGYLTVRYTGVSSAVDVKSLDAHDLTLTRKHFAPLSASLASTASGRKGAYVIATYAVRGPGGQWTAADDGSFAVALAAKQVKDRAGRYAAATVLGTFDVQIPDVKTPPAGAAQYAIADLGLGTFDRPVAINDNGVVTGSSQAGILIDDHGARHDVAVPLASGFEVQGIDGNGALGGTTYVGTFDASGITRPIDHAALYRGGVATDLGTLGGRLCSDAAGVAGPAGGDDYVTGTSYNLDENEVTFSHNHRAFLYTGGTMRDLGTLGGDESFGNAVADGGIVTGFSYTVAGAQHAFIYAGGAMKDLGTLGGSTSNGLAINRAGQVAGNSQIAGEATHAFLYSDGRMTDLGTFGGLQSFVTGIDDAGEVIGYADTSDGLSEPYVYANGKMRWLNTLIPADGGWTIQSVVAISPNGQILASATAAADAGNTYHYVLLTPTHSTTAT